MSYASHWQDDADTLLLSWQDSPEAKALLAKIDMLERAMDALAGYEISVSQLEDQRIEAENELEALREQAIEQAVDAWPDEVDGYLLDEMRDRAMPVRQAIQHARNAHVTTVEITQLEDGSWRIAA